MSLLLAFVGVSIVVIVTPGPDTALTIRNTLMGGRPGGLFSALGIAVGQLTWAAAAGAGIVAVLAASEPLFLAVKYAGAAYLGYLGLQALAEAFGKGHAARLVHGSGARLGILAAFRQGLISNLGNPKMAVFFASIFPQFAPAGAESFLSFAALGGIFAAMTFCWLTLYAALVAKAGDVLLAHPLCGAGRQGR